MSSSSRLKVPVTPYKPAPSGRASQTFSAPLAPLRVALTAQLASSDPRRGIDYPNAFVWQQIYEPVFRPGPRDTVEPCLLELPEASGDALLAAVVPGNFFSDGSAVDAVAIVKGLSECRPFTQIAAAATQRDRVLITPRRPHARFAQQLTAMHYIVAKSGSELGPMRAPLGTGPYRFADDSTPERPRLVPNAHARVKGLVPEIVGRPFALEGGDLAPIVSAMGRGEVDCCASLTEAAAGELVTHRRIAREPDTTAYLFFNTTAQGLWSREMRVALASAIDPRGYARAVFGTERAQATGILAPIFGASAIGRARPSSRAAEEIAAQRRRTPVRVPLRLLVPGASRPHTPRVQAAAAALVEAFRSVDVAVEPIVPPSTTEFARIAESNDYDLALSGWTSDTAVATDTLEALFASTSVPLPSRSVSACANLARFGNIELDRALSKAAHSGDAADVNAVLELVDHHTLVVPLTCGARAIVVRRDLPVGPGFSIAWPQVVA